MCDGGMRLFPVVNSMIPVYPYMLLGRTIPINKHAVLVLVINIGNSAVADQRLHLQFIYFTTTPQYAETKDTLHVFVSK